VVQGALASERLALPHAALEGLLRHPIEAAGGDDVAAVAVEAQVDPAPQLGLHPCRPCLGPAHL
jgi:hypothetical protein